MLAWRECRPDLWSFCVFQTHARQRLWVVTKRNGISFAVQVYHCSCILPNLQAMRLLTRNSPDLLLAFGTSGNSILYFLESIYVDRCSLSICDGTLAHTNISVLKKIVHIYRRIPLNCCNIWSITAVRVLIYSPIVFFRVVVDDVKFVQNSFPRSERNGFIKMW